MLRRRYTDSRWVKLGSIGRHWRLEEFDSLQPPTWEQFWADQRKQWGADDPDRRRVRLYFGATATEETLQLHARRSYAEFKEHLLKWNGLCKIGETAQVVTVDSSVIVLSTNWKGQVADHSDLELWIKEERVLYFRRLRFCCEIYSFGTRAVMPDSLEAALGDRVGASRVSHRKGNSPGRNETVEIDSALRTIRVSDARFKIID
jgi:hypothetical protein